MRRLFALALLGLFACAADAESTDPSQDPSDDTLYTTCPTHNVVTNQCIRATVWDPKTSYAYFPSDANGNVATSSQVIVTAGSDVDPVTGQRTVFMWVIGNGKYVSAVYDVPRPNYSGAHADLEANFNLAINSNPTQVIAQVQEGGGLLGMPIPHPTPGGDPPQFNATFVNAIINAANQYLVAYQSVERLTGIGSLEK